MTVARMAQTTETPMMAPAMVEVGLQNFKGKPGDRYVNVYKQALARSSIVPKIHALYENRFQN